MTHVLVTCTVSVPWNDLRAHIGIAEWHPIPPMQPGSYGWGCPYDCICYYSAGMLDSCLCDARMASWLCIYHLETMRCVMQAEQLSLAFLLQLPHGTEWAFM